MDYRPITLVPPATLLEIDNLRLAFRSNIPESEYDDWFIMWGMRLIALRRANQQRFITEAYNEQSSSP
jgi:hypothetical protein